MWKLKPQATLWSLKSHFYCTDSGWMGVWRNKGWGRARKEWGTKEQENRLQRKTQERVRGFQRKRKKRKRKKWHLTDLLSISHPNLLPWYTRSVELCWQRGKNPGQFEVPDNCLHTPSCEKRGKKRERKKHHLDGESNCGLIAFLAILTHLYFQDLQNLSRWIMDAEAVY